MTYFIQNIWNDISGILSFKLNSVLLIPNSKSQIPNLTTLCRKYFDCFETKLFIIKINPAALNKLPDNSIKRPEIFLN